MADTDVKIAAIVDGHWIPGSLKSLDQAELDTPAVHICPWWFLINAAAKVLQSGATTFKAGDILRNNRIPLYATVTSAEFTMKTITLCFKELAK